MGTHTESLPIPFVVRGSFIIKSLPIVLRIGVSLKKKKIGFGSPFISSLFHEMGLGLGTGQPSLTMQIRAIVEGDETRGKSPKLCMI